MAGFTWLTSEPALARAHSDRAWVDASLVGSGTVLADDPALTAREAGSLLARQPLRVILDGHGRRAQRRPPPLPARHTRGLRGIRGLFTMPLWHSLGKRDAKCVV